MATGERVDVIMGSLLRTLLTFGFPDGFFAGRFRTRGVLSEIWNNLRRAEI
jgi:hypothetical protein